MPFTKVTFGGVVDISRQDIDWTVPSAWDILLADLAAVYGEEVDDDAADDFVAKANDVNTPTVAVAANTLAGWATALYTAAATVYAASTPRRLPDRIWMSLDVWAQCRPGHRRGDRHRRRPARRADVVAGRGRVRRQHVRPAPLRRAGVPGRHRASSAHAGAYEVYEEVVGVLSAVEPALFGVQVAYGGYVAFNAVTPRA